jgi:hypothetical protein
MLSSSVALSVDDGSTVLSVVFGGNPGWSESAEGGESWCTLSDDVFTVGGGNDTDLSTAGGKVSDFVLKSVSETLVHGGTSGEDDVLAKVFSDFDFLALTKPQVSLN